MVQGKNVYGKILGLGICFTGPIFSLIGFLLSLDEELGEDSTPRLIWALSWILMGICITLLGIALILYNNKNS